MSNKDVKTFYNETMPNKFGDDYEQARWFKNPIQKAGYLLTRDAIRRHVLRDTSTDPARILELGPGAGTWTKLLVKGFPDAYLDLLDISKEMLDRAREALGENEQIRYIESDVLEWVPEGKYDYFFSSRVIEYVDDKKKFCEKVFLSLEGGGRGFIITKMPHYSREQLLGRNLSKFHQGQISPRELRAALLATGFVDVKYYPVTMSVPLLHSAFANLIVGKLFGRFRLGRLGESFTESYCVLFHKV